MSQKPAKRKKGDFDPYYYYLGISPKDQPADFYRLLGVERFESNIEIIEMASDRQMSHLHGAESGDHIDDVAKLLSEVSRARLCLLSPEKKSEYDKQLKAHLDKVEAAKASTTGPQSSTAVAAQSDNWLDAGFMDELCAAEEASRPAAVSNWELQARQLAAERARLQSAQDTQRKSSSTLVVLAIVGGACAAMLLVAALVVAIVLISKDEQDRTADRTDSVPVDEAEASTDDANPAVSDSASPQDDTVADTDSTEPDGTPGETAAPDVKQVEPTLSDDEVTVPPTASEDDPRAPADESDSADNTLSTADNSVTSNDSRLDPIGDDPIAAGDDSETNTAPQTTDQPQDKSDLRSWNSRSGEYSVQARYAEYRDGFVRLIKADGESVPVRLSDLSDKDRQWVSTIEVDALLAEAGGYLDRQDSEQARETLFQGMEFSDDIRPDFYVGMIRAVMDKDSSLARRHFSKCVKQSPDHVPSLNNLAVAELWEKNNGKSASYLKRALELEPACSEVMHNASLLMRLNGANIISLPTSTRTFLAQQVSLASASGGGLQYMDYDDGAATSRASMGWSWTSLEDHRCFICNDTGKLDCPVRKCIKGVVKIPRKQITGYNTITRAPITKTIYVPTTCTTCRGAGSRSCQACALVR